MNRSRIAAFTLVELLVVIGIIAVLTGILLPTISNAQRASQRVACAAQLRDVGNFFQMYLQDSKGRLMRVNPLPYRTPPFNEFITLTQAMEPYTKGNFASWKCRSDTLVNFKGTGAPAADHFWQLFGVSYEYNTWINAYKGGDMFLQVTYAWKNEGQELRRGPLWVFRDYSAFHDKVGKVTSRNYLYTDWSVRDASPLEEAFDRRK